MQFLNGAALIPPGHLPHKKIERSLILIMIIAGRVNRLAIFNKAKHAQLRSKFGQTVTIIIFFYEPQNDLSDTHTEVLLIEQWFFLKKT